MEHREAEPRKVAQRAGPEEGPARFLRELRQLRAGAGLGHAELAARAHYPCEAIKAAEAGPALPDLPVLSAYVRGCGGTVAEWEERWRTLTSSPALPLLPARPAGGSDAATAGARIGSVSLAADGHDPAVIMAALTRVATGISAGPSAASPAPVPDGASQFAASGPAVVSGAGPALHSGWVPAAREPFPLDATSAPAAGAALADDALPGAAPWGATASPGGAAQASRQPSASPATERAPVLRRAVGGRNPRELIAAAAAVLVCLIITIVALLS